MRSADSSLTEDESDSLSGICEEVVMANGQRASERITEEVTSWPGVLAGPGSRGEFAFKVGGREIGHLHGDHSAHFGFPKELWTCLVAEVRAGREAVPLFPLSVTPSRVSAYPVGWCNRFAPCATASPIVVGRTPYLSKPPCSIPDG